MEACTWTTTVPGTVSEYKTLRRNSPAEDLTTGQAGVSSTQEGKYFEMYHVLYIRRETMSNVSLGIRAIRTGRVKSRDHAASGPLSAG